MYKLENHDTVPGVVLNFNSTKSKVEVVYQVNYLDSFRPNGN